jgi:hypothetical protein
VRSSGSRASLKPPLPAQRSTGAAATPHRMGQSSMKRTGART